MRRLIVTFGVACALVTVPLAAKVKIQVDYDKTFNFGALRTWAWHPDGAGDVKMAVTPDDNPEDVRKRFEPVITAAITQELAQKGLTLASTGPPDVLVAYYLLLSTNMSSQYMGQFVPSTTEWGLPPFAGSTTSLKVIQQGSLVVDLMTPTERNGIWRSVAQAEIAEGRTDAQRAERIRGAVQEMLKKFPPKK